ncbi:MAG: ATP-dependent DNA helicase RecG [Christensenellaceae bacterium]
MLNLSDSVKTIHGIGEKTANLLKKLEIETISDLLYFLPRAYKDLSEVKKIGDVAFLEPAFFCVTIASPVKTAHIRKGLEITSFSVSDGSGIAKVDIFNQPHIKQYLHEGKEIYLYGKLEYKYKKAMISAPEIYFKKPEHPYLPIYPLTAGLKQPVLRKSMEQALREVALQEPYSDAFLKEFSLTPICQALPGVHFPHALQNAKEGRMRLVFDELLVFMRMIGLLNEEQQEKNEIWLKKSYKKAFLKRLPFSPTDAQLRVMGDIESDLRSPHYMNRLVQGDVGSGKTAVAMYAMDEMYQNGYKSILMAPTEILAMQHYESAKKLFPEEDVVFVSGSQTKKQREIELQKANDDRPKIIIGTHALIYSELNSKKTGLIITDEQHRFGVKQRAQLAGNHDVHTLIMSATPIPRSLSLVLYGKTKISIINELPPGRQPVKTYLIHKNKYAQMLEFINGEVCAGRQAYIVCPLIDENEDSDMPDLQLKSANELFGELQQSFPDIPMALLHGKMKNAEKEAAMEAFSKNETRILVSTTVIEVGIDVPNATVMAVINAERFGLSQLHQLRGRVGRGAHQAYCFLYSDKKESYERLRILVNSNDGFEIAEKDMQLRGAGDVFGTRQHGQGSLRIANLIEDSRLLDKAAKVLEEIKNNPLYEREYEAVSKQAQRAMQQKMIEIAFN